ncbi:unnamed protein product, partial [Pleuronectes platessa]
FTVRKPCYAMVNRDSSGTRTKRKRPLELKPVINSTRTHTGLPVGEEAVLIFRCAARMSKKRKVDKRDFFQSQSEERLEEGEQERLEEIEEKRLEEGEQERLEEIEEKRLEEGEQERLEEKRLEEGEQERLEEKRLEEGEQERLEEKRLEEGEQGEQQTARRAINKKRFLSVRPTVRNGLGEAYFSLQTLQSHRATEETG